MTKTVCDECQSIITEDMQNTVKVETELIVVDATYRNEQADLCVKCHNKAMAEAGLALWTVHKQTRKPKTEEK